MNPLERLRYIARIEGEDPVNLAIEASYVIAELAKDKFMLVSALRRLLDRHPGLGVIWMLSSRIAGSLFPEEEAWNLVAELSALPRRANIIAFPSVKIERDGIVTFQSESLGQPMQVSDTDNGLDLLRVHPTASVVVASDLVSSRFAVIHAKGLRLIEGHRALTGQGAVTICASDSSLVPPSIYDSLRSRLAFAGTEGVPLRLFDLDGIRDVVYQGDSYLPTAINRLTSWRVPQEILRSAGPLLG